MYTSAGRGGAEGEEMSVFGEDDFGQPFLYTRMILEQWKLLYQSYLLEKRLISGFIGKAYLKKYI